MEYIDEINETLTPEEDRRLNKTVIDLFAGLYLSFEAHGFKTIEYEKTRMPVFYYLSIANGFNYIY